MILSTTPTFEETRKLFEKIGQLISSVDKHVDSKDEKEKENVAAKVAAKIAAKVAEECFWIMMKNDQIFANIYCCSSYFTKFIVDNALPDLWLKLDLIIDSGDNGNLESVIKKLTPPNFLTSGDRTLKEIIGRCYFAKYCYQCGKDLQQVEPTLKSKMLIIETAEKHFPLSEAARACGSMLGIHNIGLLILEKLNIKSLSYSHPSSCASSCTLGLKLESSKLILGKIHFADTREELIDLGITYLQSAAEQNMTSASWGLATLFREKGEYLLATNWYQRALLEEGDGCHCDLFKAIELMFGQKTTTKEVNRERERELEKYKNLCHQIIDKYKCSYCATKYLKIFASSREERKGANGKNIIKTSLIKLENKDEIAKICYYFHLVSFYLYRKQDDKMRSRLFRRLSLFYLKHIDKIDFDKEYRTMLSISRATASRISSIKDGKRTREEVKEVKEEEVKEVKEIKDHRPSSWLSWTNNVICFLLTHSPISLKTLTSLSDLAENEWVEKSHLLNYIPQNAVSICYDFLFAVNF
jgi:TPR repeat protein